MKGDTINNTIKSNLNTFNGLSEVEGSIISKTITNRIIISTITIHTTIIITIMSIIIQSLITKVTPLTASHTLIEGSVSKVSYFYRPSFKQQQYYEGGGGAGFHKSKDGYK